MGGILLGFGIVVEDKTFWTLHTQIETYLVNEVGNEKDKRKNTSDQSTDSDVAVLSAGAIGDNSYPGWTPVPVGSLNDATDVGIILL